MVIILSSVVYEALFVWLWAAHYLYKHWRGSRRISTFIIFLILSDLPDLVLTPFIFQKILDDPQAAQQSDTCSLSTLFFGTRLHALYLHQMVALESVLCLRHPQYSAQTFTPTKSLVTCLSVWVSVVCLTRLSSTQGLQYVTLSVYVLLGLVPLLVAVVTCVLALTDCPISSQASSAGQGRRAGLLVTLASILTLVLVYGPLLVVMCLAHYPSSPSGGHPFYRVPEMAWVLTTSANGMRVMADPLVCVLVCSQMREMRSVTTERDVPTGVQSSHRSTVNSLPLVREV